MWEHVVPVWWGWIWNSGCLSHISLHFLHSFHSSHSPCSSTHSDEEMQHYTVIIMWEVLLRWQQSEGLGKEKNNSKQRTGDSQHLPGLWKCGSHPGMDQWDTSPCVSEGSDNPVHWEEDSGQFMYHIFYSSKKKIIRRTFLTNFRKAISTFLLFNKPTI